MVDFISDSTVLQPAFHYPAAAVRRVIAGAFGLIGRQCNCHRYVLRVGSTIQLLPGGFGLVDMRIGINHWHRDSSYSRQTNYLR